VVTGTDHERANAPPSTADQSTASAIPSGHVFELGEVLDR
jgi:hypothetical protein